MAAATTTTTGTSPQPQRKIELPPPAWGSPAHNALRKAEKEWVGHLRRHASIDATNRKAGKQSKYVDTIDIVVRYTLPPAWEALQPSAAGQKTGDELWKLPEDDKDLVTVLKAGFTPFFQRTGEFSKASPAFKMPPPKSPGKSPSELEKGTAKPTAQTSTTAAGPSAGDQPANGVAGENNGREVQPRPGYLPPFIFNMFKRIIVVFLWFFPQSLRTRIYAWWSPILGKPPGAGRR